MNIEIERKYLVLSDSYKGQATKKFSIQQGFLNSNKKRVVRIRITEEKAFLTIKGENDTKGLSRLEWEKEISLSDAKTLFTLCEPGAITKTRYEIPIANHIVEVDEFHGENEGLVVAEIELRSQSDVPELPEWIGKEVTGQEAYYNSCLSQNPFKNWQ